MNKRTKIYVNLILVILIAAVGLLAVSGIVLNILGFKYIKADNGSKFIGRTSGGVVVEGTIILPDNTTAKINRKLGTIEYSNGDKYDGEFSGFYRNGKGYMYYAATGDTYEGEFESDKISGKGIYRLADGSFYEGEFKDNKKNGQGKYTWADGSCYEGAFVNNQKHGYGMYQGADGSSYIGEYNEDRKNGTGTIKYANGDTYVGQLVNDKREGTGTYTWANGESYTGQFANNLKHGEGVYTWPAPNGRPYKGSFENGAIKIIEGEEDEEVEIKKEND